ncbi:PucR family transcriptional regulator [Frankia gtarii]|uniref:PucR family transcriptional regulator n=1 Tax=Frankia gtarii TaxID=2950102 RepID=UPI0021BF2462|nr:PucR family transcriptional regulator [Frankia gtarii]
MADAEALLAEVAARLTARTDELVERQLVALRAYPAYDRVPVDDLRRSCRRNVLRVAATLGQHALLAEVEEDERASGQRRARQGVPSDTVVQAYRAVLAVLRNAFIEEATTSGADPRAVLAVATRLWDLTDQYAGVLVSARQQVEIDSARRDERHRIAFLHRLLVGGVDQAELVAGQSVHGVLTDGRYWVFRARELDGHEDPQRLSRHLEHGNRRSLVASVEDDIAGITVTRPVPLADAVIAVTGPVPLATVSSAFAEATRVLNVALRYRRTGVVDSSSLSVRVAVEQQGELGELLHRRYLARLVKRGPAAAELIETVERWLHERRSVAATARALSVHENTVRYRLGRFAQLTDADLSDTDVLVEVWWALEYASIRPS